MLSQASNQLHTVQPSHAPTIPTTSLLLTPPSVAYPVAVDAFEQHVDVGPVPFFIYPDLRPLLPPGIAINENGPSHYNEVHTLTPCKYPLMALKKGALIIELS